MKWGEGDRWTLTMDLPPGKHEFKVSGLEWCPSCTMFGAAARVCCARVAAVLPAGRGLC